MSGSVVALDTNEAIAVWNDFGDAGKWIAGFSVVYLPVPVVGELRFGALNSQRAQENRGRVEALVAACTILDVNLVTADIYASVRFRLKQAGNPIPENDVWIAALCIQRFIPMATSYRHFANVKQLEIVQR